jgi:hypothetical protein
MTYRQRFLSWWKTARSTWLLATWESRFWVVFALLGVYSKPLRESVPVLFFLSSYANAKGAAAQGQAARMEMLESETEESPPE